MPHRVTTAAYLPVCSGLRLREVRRVPPNAAMLRRPFRSNLGFPLSPRGSLRLPPCASRILATVPRTSGTTSQLAGSCAFERCVAELMPIVSNAALPMTMGALTSGAHVLLQQDGPVWSTSAFTCGKQPTPPGALSGTSQLRLTWGEPLPRGHAGSPPPGAPPST